MAEARVVDLCCSVTVPHTPRVDVAQARAACGGGGAGGEGTETSF